MSVDRYSRGNSQGNNPSLGGGSQDENGDINDDQEGGVEEELSFGNYNVSSDCFELNFSSCG
jgi:hypothetical protein